MSRARCTSGRLARSGRCARATLRGVFLLAPLVLSAGCTSYTSLREGRYDEVEPEVLVSAGESDADDLPPAVAKLLQTRLDDPAQIAEEQAVEATIAVGKIGRPTDVDLVLDLARRDPSVSVRYFAIDALSHLDLARLRAEAPALHAAEPDPVIQDELTPYLPPPSPTPPAPATPPDADAPADDASHG